MMDALRDLNSKCDIYISNRNPWFSRGIERMNELKDLQKDANARLLAVQREYAGVCDNFLKKRLKAQEAVNQRHADSTKDKYRDDYWNENYEKERDDKVYEKESVSEIKFKKGTKKNEQILDFSEFDNILTSEHTNISTKEMLNAKTAVDLKRKNLTDDEKALLEKIASYASLRATASDYALVYWENDKEEKRLLRKYTQELEEEGRLINEIPQLIENALLAPELSAEKKAMLKSYQEIFSGFISGQLIMHKDLSYKIQLESHDFTGQDVTVQWTDVEYDKEAQENVLSQKEFELEDRTKEALFPHPPCVSDIAQGGMGDCWFLASLADLLAHDSDAVRNMMKDNGDGTVTVRFFAPYEKTSYRGDNYKQMAPVYIKVDKKVCTTTNRMSLWVQVVAKAFCAFTQVRLKKLPEKDRYANENRVYKNLSENQKVIEYGFIANGGQMSNCMQFLTGRVNAQKLNLEGGISEIDTVDTFMAQLYENSEKEAARDEANKTGAVLDRDFGVFKNKWDEVVTVHKEVLDEACTTGIDNVLKKTKRLKEVRDNIESMDKALNTVNTLLSRFLADYGGYSFNNNEGALFRKVYLKGELKREDLDEYDKRKLDSVYDLIKESFDDIKDYTRGESEKKNFIFNTFDEWMNAAGVGMQALKEEEKALKQYEETKADTIGQKEGVEEPKLTDEKKAKVRIAVKLDYAAAQLMSHVGVYAEARNYRQMFRDRKKKVEELKCGDIPLPEQGKTDRLATFASLLSITREQAFELAKKQAIKTLTQIDSAYDEAENSKNMEVFSGEYSERAIKMFKDIKMKLDKGEYVGSGSREGWGKVAKDGKESQDEGTAGNHAYSILGTKEVTMEGKKIYLLKVRNPWGKYSTEYFRNTKTGKINYRTKLTHDSGVFYMELTHFFRVFSNIYTSGDKWNNRSN
jgi:hypothetical protein